MTTICSYHGHTHPLDDHLLDPISRLGGREIASGGEFVLRDVEEAFEYLQCGGLS